MTSVALRLTRLSRGVFVCCVALASAVCGSCHRSQSSAEPAGPLAPSGQVWLTPSQVEDAKIEVQAVAEHDVDDTIQTSGRVTLDELRSAHVFSPVTGRVVQISAQLGARVKRGDRLALIESPDLGNAVSDMRKAEADLIAAANDEKRKKTLFQLKAGSAADLEAADDAWRRARAEFQRARQKAFLLRSGDVDSVTQTYSLESPIDGEILLRDVTPGLEVQGQYSGGATQELFTIGELDRVWVLGDVYEIDLARVHVGAPAEITVIAYRDKSFLGRVDWVSGMLDPNTRTAKARFKFDNPEHLLRPEMYATVRISVDSKRALAIPRGALLRLGEYKVVFIEVGKSPGAVRFERVPVEVDEAGSGPLLHVTHGLEAGQEVVVSGAILLSQKL